MSVTYGFYNSKDGDRRYDAFQMSSIFDGIIEDGIFQSIGDQFEVTPATLANGSKMAIKVGRGRAWFNHTWTLNSATLPIEISHSEILTDRIDAVVIEIDSRESARRNRIRIIKGTPSTNAKRPTLTKSAQVNQYPLAYISVKAKSTEIRHADITNKIGSDDTPFVTGPLTVMSAEQFWNQWNDEWDIWMDHRNDEAQASNDAFDLWISQRKTAFSTIMSGHENDAKASKNAFNTWIQDTKKSFDSTMSAIETDASNKRNAFDTWIQQRQAMFTATLNDIIDDSNDAKSAFDSWIAAQKISWNDMMAQHNADIEGDRAAFNTWINTKKFDFGVLMDGYADDAETAKDNFISTIDGYESEALGFKDSFDSWISQREGEFNTTLSNIESASNTRKNQFDTWATSAESSMNAWIQQRQNDFDDWFDSIKDIFDENVIGNLQNQIDDRLKFPRSYSALDISGVSTSYNIPVQHGESTPRRLSLGVLKDYILGDIDTVLDSLNGEVI